MSRAPDPSRQHGGPRSTAGTWTVVEGYRMHARVPARQVQCPHTDPLVLVHGLGVSSRYMVPTLVQLAPTLRVFAPDLPGFGRSDKPRRALSLGELADSLAAWMSATGLPRAVLLGNSLGCQVITTFAQAHPARVSRAILVGPTCDPAAPSARRQALRLLLDAPGEGPTEAALAGLDYLRAGPIRMWRTLNDAMSSPVEAQLAQLRVPTLVVRGARDPIVSQQWAEKVTAVLPRGRLAVVPDAPHALNYSAATPLVELVRGFLAEDTDEP